MWAERNGLDKTPPQERILLELQLAAAALDVLKTAIAVVWPDSNAMWEPGFFRDELAKAKGENVRNITAVILDRDRHIDLIAEVRSVGARIRLIPDGDVAGAISTAWPESGADILFGVGGTPEGVISAAALKCMGGEMQGRLWPRNDGERKAAKAKRMIDRVRTFIGYREYPKYGMISRYFVYKQALLEEAERLLQTHALRDKEDIFYLTFQELQEVALVVQGDPLL